ncbi:MAG TPA: hypothetical protein DDW49_10120 [Deltaproteobacteria bacterium]|nr:MAG: hypothetical protein A2048_08295 [Deltaproteobacteria bacterium GWA2_45_12]HBF13718.1 hypothetical protein [Deltaproteobacteria bacterium]
MEYLVFTMVGEEFGVPISQVKEILKTGPVSPLPRAPEFVDGIMRVRNHSIVVLDLRKHFGLPVVASHPADNVVVMRHDKLIFGCLVDSVVDVVNLSSPQVDAGLRGVTHFIDKKLIEGVALHGKRTIILVNVGCILNHDEKYKLEQLER